ncbi:ribonuclease E/G [Sphingomonas sanguinis]|uniref:Rne/Rng family ribonuclease n=1 Tax=Sphingomonas sp. LC-1 TaxID=3110957 RepID=UPI0021BA82E5|nr:ribonuclease E/G [Sphingomonas sp. LC-1]MCT8001349.1 ribonuclease E/G [Sphingomonas sp. LC-1]
MTTRMLIDARHREETRVAVVKGNRIEEFDFESAERKQLKGNIYLAKVTRVEPSLQAAFVDYGGNRHGFLAFSEIHPDYYQIPKEDREALLREEAEHAAEEAALRAELDAEDEEDLDGEGEDDHADDHHDDEDGDAAPRPKKSTVNDDQVEALRQRRQNLRRRYKIQDVIHRRQVLLVQIVKEERGNKGAALTTYLSLAGRYCVLMPNTSHGGGISRKISNAADRKRLKSIMADMALPSTMGCIVRTAGLQRTKTEIKRDFDYLARLWDGIREKTLHSSAPALIYGDSDLIKRAIRDIYNREIEEVIVEGEEGYRQAKDFMRLLMPAHARRVKQYADAVPLFQRAHVEDQLAAMYNPVVQLKSGGYLVINPTEALVSIDINSGRSTREHNIEQTATATNLEAAQEIARQLRLRDMAGLVVIDFIDMDNNSNVRKVEKAMKEALKNDRARIQVGRISSFGLMEMSRQRLRTGVLEASTRPCPHCEGTGLVRTASSSGLSALRLIEDEAARGRGSILTLRASQEAAVYVLNRKRADIAEIEDRYGVTVEIIPDREEEGARMTVEASGPPPAYAPKIDMLLPVEEDEDDLIDEIEEEEEEEVEEEATEAPAPRESREDGEGGGRKRRRRRRGRRNRGGAEDAVQGEEADNGEHTELEETDEVEDETVEANDVEAGEAETGETEAGEAREGGRRRRGRRGRRGGRRQDNGATEAGEASTETAGENDVAEAPLSVEEPIEAGDAAPVTTPLAVAEAEATEAPKTRRRPRARKAAPAVTETVETPVAEAPIAEPVVEEAPAVAAEAEAPAKPKRVRKKAAPKVAAEPVVEEAPAPEAEVPAKPKRVRKKAAPKVAAEPVAEEAPAVEAEPAPAAEPAEADATSSETPRRGWWQRTFGA